MDLESLSFEIPDGCPVSGLVTAIALCVVFGALFALTSFQIVCIRMRSSFCGSQLILHSLILVSMAARFVNLVIVIISTEPVGFCPTSNTTNGTTPNNNLPLLQTPPTETIAFVVSLLPTAIFFSVNSFLVLTWTKIYFSAIHTAKKTRVVLKTLFILSNTLCAGLVVAEMIFATFGSSEGFVMNEVGLSFATTSFNYCSRVCFVEASLSMRSRTLLTPVWLHARSPIFALCCSSSPLVSHFQSSAQWFENGCQTCPSLKARDRQKSLKCRPSPGS